MPSVAEEDGDEEERANTTDPSNISITSHGSQSIFDNAQETINSNQHRHDQIISTYNNSILNSSTDSVINSEISFIRKARIHEAINDVFQWFKYNDTMFTLV
jgi:hypothetical protein